MLLEADGQTPYYPASPSSTGSPLAVVLHRRAADVPAESWPCARRAGLPAGGLDTVCAGLTAQQAADGNPWTDLIVTSGGQNLRALSPQNGIVLNSSLLSGYYDDYVSQVWQMYESATLTVDTQAGPVSSGSPALLGCRWGRCTEGYGCPLVRDVTARSASFYRVLRLTAPSGW